MVGCLPTGNPVILRSTYLTSSAQGFMTLIPGFSILENRPKAYTRPASLFLEYLCRSIECRYRSTGIHSRQSREHRPYSIIRSKFGKTTFLWVIDSWDSAGSRWETAWGYWEVVRRSLLHRFRSRVVGYLSWLNLVVFVDWCWSYIIQRW